MNWAQSGPGAPAGSTDAWTTPPQRYDAQAATDGFGGGPEIQLVTPNKPPLIWLAVGIALAVAALLVGLIGQSATTGLIGWILAGPLAITAVALFTAADAKKRESGWYTPSGLADWGRRAAIVLALIAVALCAWFIANDVARGTWT